MCIWLHTESVKYTIVLIIILFIMVNKKLFTVALLIAKAAALSSKFTKVPGDGTFKKYFDLSPESDSMILTEDGGFVVP